MPICHSEFATALARCVAAGSGRGAGITTERRQGTRCSTDATCELWILQHDGKKEKVADVAARNSSFNGLCVVVDRAKPIGKGLPVEVRTCTAGDDPTHVAGTVAFARNFGEGSFEVGIHVMAVGSTWILADDVDAAKKRYEWFAKALMITH